MASITEQNKAIVNRFNKECIEQGDTASFDELLAPDCINHAAPPGASNGPDGMIYFLKQVLKPAFPDLKVLILDQVAEGDRVVSRKELHGTHTGDLMGIPATHKKLVIHVIDIIRLRDGQYAEHWGMSDLHSLMAELSKGLQ
jgi:steroid delta-isomerase-like uncharacterized protein